MYNKYIGIAKGKMVSDIICSICVLFLLCFFTCAKADILDKCNDDGIYCETLDPKISSKCKTPATCPPVLVLTNYTAEDGSVSITVGIDTKDSVCAVLAFSEDKTNVNNIGTLIFMKDTSAWTVLYKNSDEKGDLFVPNGKTLEDSVQVVSTTGEDYSVYTFKILEEISGDNGMGKISPNVTYYYKLYDGEFNPGPPVDCQNVYLTTNGHTVSENKYVIAASADKAMLAGYTLLTGLIFLILQH